MESLKKSPLFGSSNPRGPQFDDQSDYTSKIRSLPIGICIRRGAIIDNIAFIYGVGKIEHGGTGGTEKSIPLNNEEYITKVTGNYTTFGSSENIESLAFYTNQGRTISFGTPVNCNKYFEYSTELNSAICCLYGHAGRYLEHIGFYQRNIFSGIPKF